MQDMGILYAWQQADYVSKSIAFLLVIMSVLSWSVMLLKTIQLIRLNHSKRKAVRFWHASSFSEGLSMLRQAENDPFRELAETGRAANLHHNKQNPELLQRLDPSEWMTRCLKTVLDTHVARLQAGLAILASIGSTAPFIGLFGTVWGIYHALRAIGEKGEASLSQVAGPVGESLIMTAFGLFVAIPAVLGYNAIARQNRGVMHYLSRFANDLHAFFLTGSRMTVSKNGGEEHSATSEAVDVSSHHQGTAK